MSKYLIVFLLLCSLVQVGCLPKRSAYPMNESPWVQLPGNQYIFDDGFLKITFEVERLMFHYVFRNTGDRAVTIVGSSLMLKQEANSQDFALWGEPQKLNVSMSNLVLSPRQFMRLSYPVRVRSPFYPFRPPASPVWYLQFKAIWAFEERLYVLPFPQSFRLQQETGTAAPATSAASENLKN